MAILLLAVYIDKETLHTIQEEYSSCLFNSYIEESKLADTSCHITVAAEAWKDIPAKNSLFTNNRMLKIRMSIIAQLRDKEKGHIAMDSVMGGKVVKPG